MFTIRTLGIIRLNTKWIILKKLIEIKEKYKNEVKELNAAKFCSEPRALNYE